MASIFRIERLIGRIALRLSNLRNRLVSWRMGKDWLETTGFNSYYNGRHFNVSGCRSCYGHRMTIVADSEYVSKCPRGTLLYKLCDCTNWKSPHYTGIVYGKEAIAFKLKQLGIKK